MTQPTTTRAARRHRRPLSIAFALVVMFLGVELIAGALTGSLALISDAGHMATDALGMGMALAAIVAADRASDARGRTYGLYRLEILAALANAVLLFGLAAYVIFEAIQRLQEPTEVLAGPMLVVALVGLVANVVAWRLLRAGAGESITIEGVYVEVLADLAGSLAVIVAAVITLVIGWAYADPLFAVLIGVFILPRAWHLGSRALRVLVEAAPTQLDLDTVRRQLSAIPGVVDVHDLHVWTLTSDMDVATAHLMTTDVTDPHPVLDQARRILREEHAIGHATLQVEPESHRGCTEVTW